MGAVNALAFSENGYYMASAGQDGKARLWDLRKLTNFHNLDIGQTPASSVAFDFSGSYLAAGGQNCTKVLFLLFLALLYHSTKVCTSYKIYRALCVYRALLIELFRALYHNDIVDIIGTLEECNWGPEYRALFFVSFFVCVCY